MKYLVDAEIEAAAEIGIRFHPTRGFHSVPSDIVPPEVVDTKESVTEDVFETPWLRRLLELKDIEELDRDIIVEMIDQITVYENHKLKISYNFGNELEHLFSSVYCEDLEKKAI